MGLDKQLRELDDIRTGLRKTSDMLTEKIGTTAMTADELLDEKRLQLMLAKAEGLDDLENWRGEIEQRAKDLRARRTAVLEKVRGNACFGEQRLLSAFPGARRSKEGSTASLILLRAELERTRRELARTQSALAKAQAELEQLRKAS